MAKPAVEEPHEGDVTLDRLVEDMHRKFRDSQLRPRRKPSRAEGEKLHRRLGDS